MNLDDIRRELDSEARRAVYNLEQRIRSLESENRSLKDRSICAEEYVSELNRENDSLRRRVYKLEKELYGGPGVDPTNPNSLVSLAMLNQATKK